MVDTHASGACGGNPVEVQVLFSAPINILLIIQQVTTNLSDSQSLMTMSNPFQEQLLKTGIVSKQQAHNAKTHKTRKNKQQRAKKTTDLDETKLKVQQAAAEKAQIDRALNKKKDEAARVKAIAAEIDQLIIQNAIECQPDGEIAYHFEHGNKIKSIYVNNETREKIMAGILGIAYTRNHYELLPKAIIEKIQERDSQRVILIEKADPQQSIDDNDPYARHPIPDDLIW